MITLALAQVISLDHVNGIGSSRLEASARFVKENVPDPPIRHVPLQVLK